MLATAATRHQRRCRYVRQEGGGGGVRSLSTVLAVPAVHSMLRRPPEARRPRVSRRDLPAPPCPERKSHAEVAGRPRTGGQRVSGTGCCRQGRPAARPTRRAVAHRRRVALSRAWALALTSSTTCSTTCPRTRSGIGSAVRPYPGRPSAAAPPAAQRCGHLGPTTGAVRGPRLTSA